MSIVHLRDDNDNPGAAVSGSGMDRVVVSRKLPLKYKLAAGVVALLLAAAAFWYFAPRSDSQSVAASRLTISTVSRGTFDDFIPLRARVTPLQTVFLDAIEGGRVEKVLVEDGASLAAGQPIALLSNAELQLSVLARQSEVTEQLNNMRSQELALAQTQLANERSILEADLARTKAERQYAREKALAARGFVAAKTFSDTSDSYAYERERGTVLRRGQATDRKLMSSQLAQLRASSNSLMSSLALARGNLDALNLRAPVAGQLSGFSIQVGQSLSRGQRIGQIDSPGRNKLIAGVDEYYLGRVVIGQKATIDVGGKSFAARVSKIYPQVQNGEFQLDLQFIGVEPKDIQRGQSLQARLTLGDPAPAILLPNGAFYNETGGTWVFVVAPGGGQAIKRQVRMGRRNTESIEILDGLDPGERVITSPYTGFADKAELSLAK
ncbi:efflux RND transporter periplasmic adaptor subunit [Sphingomonas sp. PB4P5]|uniref:efflux RND transporter periplasmic adaptor subunit n=1 Tax=Parasphingomonas puruogangriensis TaxID=3096155 RepID=UPI002FC8E0D4